jgi:hypothetical protein
VADSQYGVFHMPRFHNVNNERIAFTEAEETQRDAEEIKVRADKAAFQALQWKRDRRSNYAPIGDQLDNITKAFKFIKAAGTDIGSDGDAQIAMSDAVKAAHPKP